MVPVFVYLILMSLVDFFPKVFIFSLFRRFSPLFLMPYYISFCLSLFLLFLFHNPLMFFLFFFFLYLSMKVSAFMGFPHDSIMIFIIVIISISSFSVILPFNYFYSCSFYLVEICISLLSFLFLSFVCFSLLKAFFYNINVRQIVFSLFSSKIIN